MNFVIGHNDGNVVYSDFLKTPNLLIAGSLGSGKDFFIFTLLKDLLKKNTEDQLKVYIINPFPSEFTNYIDLNDPKIIGNKVFASENEVEDVLKEINDEIMQRYNKFVDKNVSNINQYNELSTEKLPRIIVVIHEYYEYITGSNKEKFTEQLIKMIRFARSAGVHPIIATERVCSETMPDNLLWNFAGKIAFHMDGECSKQFLENEDAEKLVMREELIYRNDYNAAVYKKLNTCFDYLE